MTKLRSGRTAEAGGDKEDGVPKSSATRKRAQPSASTTGGKAPRKKVRRGSTGLFGRDRPWKTVVWIKWSLLAMRF